MQATRRIIPAILLVALAFLPQNHAQVLYTSTYPQIVRISYLDGDVRLTRAPEKGDKDPDWEKATPDTPLETGISLVTGNGRAEIEFEDASTLYLAENSVLTFNDLRTTNGVPFTSMALLSGTVTLHLRPYVSGETFLLRTPTDALTVVYPRHTYARVTSYLNAMSVTPQQPGVITVPGNPTTPATTIAAEITHTYNSGHLIRTSITPNPDFADWDKWVAARVAARNAANKEMMQQSGLGAPVPGLADLAGAGSFFPCDYGSCWESNDLWPDAFFPCVPPEVSMIDAIDPTTGDFLPIDSAFYPFDAPYYWAVCHTGSWIHYRNRYAWVPGEKRHHRYPVRWVKTGRTTAFVPIHPRDVTGKPPLNMKDGVFTINARKPSTVDWSHPAPGANPGKDPTLLASTPKEFLKPISPPLEKTDAPHMEAHTLPSARPTAARPAPTPIAFDNKSHTFMLAHQVTMGNKSATVLEAFNSRTGNLQTHAVGVDSHGNYDTRAANSSGGPARGSDARSGGFSGGSRGGDNGSRSGGSSSGGGGGHSGGGFSGGGGGGFSGGGGRGGGGGGHH